MFSTQHRGQIGIGTLIVFIAMVMVAAIAAGVLVNSAGLLQAQAQQTGEETTAEVSDTVQLSEVVGLDTTGDKRLDKIRISVRLASGSDAVDLGEMSYTLEADGTSIIVGTSDGTGIVQGINLKQGFTETTTVMDEQDQLAQIFINLSKSDIDNLKRGDKLTIIAQSPAGGNIYKQVSAPERIDSGGSYIL